MIDLEFRSQTTPPEKWRARRFGDVGDSVLYHSQSEPARPQELGFVRVARHPEWCNEKPFLENFAVDDHGMLLAVVSCASTARWSFLRALTCRRERRNFTRKCPGGEL